MLGSYGRASPYFKICVQSHAALHLKAKWGFFGFHAIVDIWDSWTLYAAVCVWIYVWEFTDRLHLQCLSLHIFSVCTEFFRKDPGSHISLSDQLVSCTSHYFIQCWGFQAMLLNPARQLLFPFQLQKALISLVFLSNRNERWVQPSNLHLW